MSSLTADSQLGRKLVWLWELIDISDNIRKAELEARRVGNGWITSGMHLVAYAFLTMITLALAWHFDFESTLVGMSNLQNQILPGLPSSVAKFSYWLALGFTIAPTLIEIFTAAYAKAEIKIMQLVVVGFTAFDMVTDIPRAKAFTDSLDAHFAQMGILSGLAYWAFFIFWLFFSTIGFELLMIIFAYLTLLFIPKTLANPSIGAASIPKGNGNAQPKQATVKTSVAPSVTVVDVKE